MHSLYLAWRYLSYHKARSLTLIACVTLIALLPLALDRLLAESERQLLSRADATPLLLGAKGSALDLAMNSLYFSDPVPELISLAESEALEDPGLAQAIPLYVRFRARGYPIVGTSLDYFEFRRLELAAGPGLGLLGDCVLGAEVAADLGLGPGDHLVSTGEALFDLAGIYPLKMRVAGVLAPSGSPDDRAVFVDIKTAWVIEGLVHGHQDLAETDDPSLVMARDGQRLTASPKLIQYNQITPENIASFHFHGDPAGYPLSALLVLPEDTKSATLLRGRYLEVAGQQLLRPRQVIDGLMQNIFRIARLIDLVLLLVGAATGLALVLVFALSLRLRQRELQTIFRLGCARATIARLLAAEILLIALASALLCGLALLVLQGWQGALVRHWLL